MHVPVNTFAPWRCPNENGDRHHVLLIDEADSLLIDDDPNPFIAFRQNMMWWQFAMARGMTDNRSIAVVEEVVAEAPVVEEAIVEAPAVTEQIAEVTSEAGTSDSASSVDTSDTEDK